jgi:rod shape determining protein RodA
MRLFSTQSFALFDWISFGLVSLISLIGLLFVLSATYTPEIPLSHFFLKQAMGMISGICIYTLCSLLDHRTLMRLSYFGYLTVIGLLIFTLIKGSIGLGAQRWINLGIIKVQPSELAKLLFPGLTAYYVFTHKQNKPFLFTDFIPLLGILGLSFVLILKQPDLGTALIIAFSGLILLWLAGIPKTFFIVGFIGSALATPLLWHGLKEYQKQRVAVFMGYGDVKKERYQIEQAAIAIGSGGIWGKGFMGGTQNKLRFLPESRTDFIFAVVCEECGFLGAAFIIFLYLLLFTRLFIRIALLNMPHIQLLAAGILMHIVLSTCINTGMVVGLLPIVGIPLPLMSYGISNLWITYASFGWLQGIIMQRQQLDAYGTTLKRNIFTVQRAHTMH